LLLLHACADPVKGTPVTADIGPAELGHFPVGASWSWLRNGEPLTVTLVSMDNGIGAYESSNGCKYWQGDNYFVPETEVRNCYGYSGTTETEPSQPDIWPLAVGKTQTWTTRNRNSKDGDTWTSRQTCTVESTEHVTVPAGAFDTYKTVCEDEAFVIRNWYSPDLKTTVLQTITRKGEGLRSKLELVSASPASS
jgi:hypothetical protein